MIRGHLYNVKYLQKELLEVLSLTLFLFLFYNNR